MQESVNQTAVIPEELRPPAPPRWATNTYPDTEGWSRATAEIPLAKSAGSEYPTAGATLDQFGTGSPEIIVGNDDGLIFSVENARRFAEGILALCDLAEVER